MPPSPGSPRPLPEVVTAPSGDAPSGATLRFPALLWALFHAPVVLVLYRTSLARAIYPLTGGYRVAMLFAWGLEAVFISLIAFLAALPFSLRWRSYRWAAPAIAAALTAFLAVDSRLYDALEFHLNSLILRVAFQKDALHQIGLDAGEFALFMAALALFVVLDISIGGRFIVRWSRPGPRWAYLALVALLPVDRLIVAALEFTGGRAVYAAGNVLPLQVPFRMNHLLEKLTGRTTGVTDDPLAAAASLAPDLDELPADSAHLARTPDIVLVLVESLPAGFFSPDVMPRLTARAAHGAVFTRHYASASSTHYALFSFFYGRESRKMERIVGAGRAPMLFGALRRHGYAFRLITASSADWMGMRHSVFHEVADDLDTDMPGVGAPQDSAMLARARTFVDGAGDRPIFLLLFFNGTHFNYTYPPRSARFVPAWDGSGSLEAARVDTALLRNRGRNAAYEVDWKLDEFLDWFAARRARSPLLLVTGDHGEAFGEHGRVGHGSGITDQELHVPMVVLDDSMPVGRYAGLTSHVDVVPTLLRLLGDRHPSSTWSDGMVMNTSPRDRFVLATAGWVPRFAVVGHDLKAAFWSIDAGLGGVDVTDPQDLPVTDGQQRLRREASAILRALRGR
jgi:hypothetical protein